MKIVKLLIVITLYITTLNTYATTIDESKENIECKEKLSQRKEEYKPVKITGTKVLNNLYQLCLDSNKDIVLIKEKKELGLITYTNEISKENIQSDVGFLIVFGSFQLRVVNQDNNLNDSFNDVKMNYEKIKKQYLLYIKNKNENLITNVDKLSNRYKKLKAEVEINNKTNKNMIDWQINFLDFTLSSEKSYQSNKEAYIKFIPNIMVEKEQAQFQNQTLTMYEYNFLRLYFSDENLEKLKKKLNLKIEQE